MCPYSTTKNVIVNLETSERWQTQDTKKRYEECIRKPLEILLMLDISIFHFLLEPTVISTCTQYTHMHIIYYICCKHIHTILWRNEKFFSLLSHRNDVDADDLVTINIHRQYLAFPTNWADWESNTTNLTPNIGTN